MSLVDLSSLNLDVEGTAVPQWSVKVGDYRYVLFTTGKALVFKGGSEEPSYEITPLGCSCPGDRYNSNPCKHRKAITYLGDGSAVPPEEGTTVEAKKEQEPHEIEADDLFG